MVPFNIKIGNVEIPIGLPLIFLVLIAAAVINLFTKDVATRWGLGFTGTLLLVFVVTERYYEYRRRGRSMNSASNSTANPRLSYR